jgi:hypothetical protein
LKARDYACAVRAFALAMALSLTACSGEHERTPIRVPQLPEGPLELRVAFLLNERLPKPSPAELEMLLDSARQAVQTHFGREVRFTRAEVRPIDAYFQSLPSEVKASAKHWIYDFKLDAGDRFRLRKTFEEDLRKSGDDLDAMIEYARPFLLQDMREKTFAALTEALIATQLLRLRALSAESASNGSPLIDGQPYNEVIYWDAMSFAALPYEVVLTNQLFASVEYTMNSVHSALRGGITNGLTTPNPLSRFGTTAIVSTYPMFGTDRVVTALRGDETYDAQDAARFAGVVLAHEIGHQLWHLGHPYGRPACVMNPTPLLQFRRWVEALAPGRCRIGSDAAMTPGFSKFFAVNTNWRSATGASVEQ